MDSKLTRHSVAIKRKVTPYALSGQSPRADHTEHKLLKRLGSYDILLIDEIGYEAVEKALQAER